MNIMNNEFLGLRGFFWHLYLLLYVDVSAIMVNSVYQNNT